MKTPSVVVCQSRYPTEKGHSYFVKKTRNTIQVAINDHLTKDQLQALIDQRIEVVVEKSA